MKTELTKKTRQFVWAMLICLMALVALFSISGCESDGEEESAPTPAVESVEATKAEKVEKVAEDLYSVSLGIDCDDNFFFSRYDIEIYVDGSSVGLIDHGTSKSFDLELAEGSHSLKVVSRDDASVDGNVQFEVAGGNIPSISSSLHKFSSRNY